MDYQTAQRIEMQQMPRQIAALINLVDSLTPNIIEGKDEYEGIEYLIVNQGNARQRAIVVDGATVTGVQFEAPFWVWNGRRDRHIVRAARYALEAYLNS